MQYEKNSTNIEDLIDKVYTRFESLEESIKYLKEERDFLKKRVSTLEWQIKELYKRNLELRHERSSSK